MNNLLHYQNVSHYQKVKKTTEVLIILICSQKIKVYCLRKLIACVQIAERSANFIFTTTNSNYATNNVQHNENISHHLMVKGQKTTEVFIILICRQKISFLSAISKHVFEMLRGVQVQLFFFTNKNSNYATIDSFR